MYYLLFYLSYQQGNTLPKNVRTAALITKFIAKQSERKNYKKKTNKVSLKNQNF